MYCANRVDPNPHLHRARCLAQIVEHDAADELIALVERAVLEHDKTGSRPRFTLAPLGDFGLHANRIADENGIRHVDGVVAEICDQRAERRVADGDPHHQRRGIKPIHDDTAELRSSCIHSIEVQRLRIVSEGREQQVVGLRDRATQGVRNRDARLPILVVATAHRLFQLQASLSNPLRESPCH